MSSGDPEQDSGGQDEDRFWTTVDVDAYAATKRDGDESDAESMVIVSRASSPLTVQFHDIRVPSPRVEIRWPSTLPWFRFQEMYFDDTGIAKTFLRSRLAVNGEKTQNQPQVKDGALTVIMGASNFELSASPQSINTIAAEFGKSMPERYPGENFARVEALVGDDPLEAKLEALRLLAYQISNNLIEDDDDVELEELDDVNSWSRFGRMVRMFREIDLPRDMWVDTFSSGEKGPTSAAFAEALFGAAVNCNDAELLEAALKVGIDPNTPVRDLDGRMQRPIQLSFADLDCAGLLLRYGANVDGVTEDEEWPALHNAARRGHLERAKLLVENGADIRRPAPSRFSNEADVYMSPLVASVDCPALNSRRTNNDDSAEEDEHPRDRPARPIFEYLLPLYNNHRDRHILRDALLVAAKNGRCREIRMLHAAGVNVNPAFAQRCGPLEAAIRLKYPKTVATLLELGADPKYRGGSRSPSLLHVAAAGGDAAIVRLLVNAGVDIDATANIRPSDCDRLGGSLGAARHDIHIKRAIRHLHTSLQIALHTDAKKYHFPWSKKKTEASAMLLLRSGAKLRGAELVLAVQFDNLTLVKLLLRRGADVNQEDWEGRTPLQACLAAGNYRLVGTLLAAGAELKGGELYAAFRTGRHDVVNTLVGHGARFDDTGPGGESVLEAACSTINQTLMLWASRRGPSPYDSGALCAAVRTWIKNDRDYYLSQLLRGRELGRHEPLLEGTAVGMAAYSANKQILRCLLELPTTQTCLIPFSGYHGYQALFRGWDSNIKESYEREFWHDRSQIKCSVLVPALLGRDWGMVRTLLHAGYCPDTLSLLVAISQDRGPETIKVLITYGADVNGRLPWPDLESPLQAAVRLKRVKVVKTLLAHGAEVNAPPPLRVSAREWQRRDDPDQAMPRTALQAAVEHGHLPLIEMLLDAGADVNGPCAAESGATALQVAAAKGFLGIAKRLLELGADVNANRAATAGRTALEIAAEHGRLDMVQFLLENGASTQGGGLWQYHRAIGFAEVNGHRTIARLLKEWREWEPVDERCGVFPKLLSDDFWPVSPYSWDSDECVDEEEEEEEDDDEDEDWDNSTDNESTEDDG